MHLSLIRHSGEMGWNTLNVYRNNIVGFWNVSNILVSVIILSYSDSQFIWVAIS